MFIMKVNAKIARVNRVRAISFVKESSNFILGSEVISVHSSDTGAYGFKSRLFLKKNFFNGMVPEWHGCETSYPSLYVCHVSE